MYNWLINCDLSRDWQLSFQDEASLLMIGIRDLHDEILFYLIIILILVLYFLIYCVNQVNINIKSKDLNHSFLLEFIWTIMPALVLIIIAIPSFKLLYTMDEIYNPLITLKIQGNQWYWSYNISDINECNIDFTSYMNEDYSLLRYLEVDNRILLPIHTPIRILVTATDVMHAWTIPSLGIKIDAIPNRINSGIIYILRKGIFYGQCSELCGQRT